MRIIKQKAEFVTATSMLQPTVERAGRVCYKSETHDDPDESDKFILGMIKRGHHSVIEHGVITLKFTTDRGVSHEIVRHRIASYSQESTRYCNYNNNKFGSEITCILPVEFYELHESDRPFENPLYASWNEAMWFAEAVYKNMLRDDATPQLARSVLPNSLKTEMYMTANIREWRHFFTLRCAPAAHPQMRQLAFQALALCKQNFGLFFNDLYPAESV